MLPPPLACVLLAPRSKLKDSDRRGDTSPAPFHRHANPCLVRPALPAADRFLAANIEEDASGASHASPFLPAGRNTVMQWTNFMSFPHPIARQRQNGKLKQCRRRVSL